MTLLSNCEYCEATYHPMRVYVPDPPKMGMKMEIRVCRSEACREQAKKDGYTYREDLTPITGLVMDHTADIDHYYEEGEGRQRQDQAELEEMREIDRLEQEREKYEKAWQEVAALMKEVEKALGGGGFADMDAQRDYLLGRISDLQRAREQRDRAAGMLHQVSKELKKKGTRAQIPLAHEVDALIEELGSNTN